MSLVSGTVLLTGATGGIGHALARAFGARGAKLILTGRRSELLEALATELDARAVTCDLAVRADVERLVGEVGELDVLVANAALPASGELTELTQDQIDRMLEVNLRAPITIARGLAPRMIARGRGQMVFISSLAGKAASPASSIYSATKFGIRGFALGIREDLRPYGVGVSTVCPGFVSDAGMFAEAGMDLPRGVGTRTPEQVAQAVIRAIERNLAEIDVAPASLRAGTMLAQVAPGIAANLSRLLGSNNIAAGLADGQRSKR